jgi:hypothetical protein
MTNQIQMEREASLNHYMMMPEPQPPTQSIFDISITKPMLILLFFAFLLGLFIGRSFMKT